jgi:exodeoxyribonuclease V alpha subunit
VRRPHATYGGQVHIETAILAAPSGRLVVDFLVRHPAFKGLGIGKARARRLWEALGQDLGVVLGQGVVEKLTGVLSAECARKLVEAWQAVSEEAGIIAFLDHHGFDLHLANKIRTVWPRDTLAKLRENEIDLYIYCALHVAIPPYGDGARAVTRTKPFVVSSSARRRDKRKVE